MKFRKFTQNGWDKQTEFYTISLEHQYKDILEVLVKDQIHSECITTKGDFGIILMDIDHVTTDYYHITQREMAAAI